MLCALLAPGSAAPDEEQGPGRVVDLYYVTDRSRAHTASGADYGGERGPVDQGRCAVTYSPIPVLDRLAEHLPFYVPEALQEVGAVPLADRSALLAALEQWMGAAADRKLVLFVHGYSQDFGRACRRAAALQQALGPDRRVVLFTWPSDGDPTEYASDATDMEWSVPDLAGLISDLTGRFGAERLQAVAHSMGARAVVLALDRLGCRSGRRARLHDLVLVAPDIDRAIFLQRYEAIRDLAGPVTLYVSENDTVIGVSRQLHGHPRLGEGGDYRTVIEGIETVDVTPIGRYQITGHEYHYYHPRVARDLRELLSEGRSAAARTGLEAREQDGRRWWSMQPLDGGAPAER